MLDLSFEFAVVIVNVVDGVTMLKSAYMTDQLARDGTSVGAKENGKYAFIIQSKDDLNKSMQINFFGYESQDEVLDVLSSLKIK